MAYLRKNSYFRFQQWNQVKIVRFEWREREKERKSKEKRHASGIMFTIFLFEWYFAAMAALFCPSTFIFCSPHIIYQYDFTRSSEIPSVYVMLGFFRSMIFLSFCFALLPSSSSCSVLFCRCRCRRRRHSHRCHIQKFHIHLLNTNFSVWNEARTQSYFPMQCKNEYNKFIVPSRDLFNISTTMWFVLQCSSLSCSFLLCFVLAGSLRFNVEFLVAHCWSVLFFVRSRIHPSKRNQP